MIILHSWVGQRGFTSQVRFIGSYYQDFLILSEGFNYICLVLIPPRFFRSYGHVPRSSLAHSLAHSLAVAALYLKEPVNKLHISNLKI